VSAVKAAVVAGYKTPNGGPPVIMIETATMGASHQR
jgi:hypothetical protein